MTQPIEPASPKTADVSVPSVAPVRPGAQRIPDLGLVGAGASGPNAIGPVALGPVTPAAVSATPFTWHGSPWSLVGACFINAVLMILTVGVYGFWGRTEIRRRMWSSVRFMDEPLAYHGTPQELLKGFMAVLAAVLLPLFIIGTFVVIMFGQASGAFVTYQTGLFLGIYPILAAIAFYRARRYRLSRTSWRGVRGSISGSSTNYGFLSWALACAYPFTLGWIAPYRAVSLNKRIVLDTQLGDRQLTFIGASAPLYGPFALLWFGSVVLYFVGFALLSGAVGVGIGAANPFGWAVMAGRDWAILVGTLLAVIFVWSMMSSFYYAKLYNLCASSTLMMPARQGDEVLRFKLNVGGMKLIWLYVTNMLITYLSLYILRPVATARSMKYYIEHLSLEGAFDPASVSQNRALIDKSGEGLGQAFDLDAF